jgi:hypothetical protein
VKDNAGLRVEVLLTNPVSLSENCGSGRMSDTEGRGFPPMRARRGCFAVVYGTLFEIPQPNKRRVQPCIQYVCRRQRRGSQNGAARTTQN